MARQFPVSWWSRTFYRLYINVVSAWAFFSQVKGKVPSLHPENVRHRCILACHLPYLALNNRGEAAIDTKIKYLLTGIRKVRALIIYCHCSVAQV